MCIKKWGEGGRGERQYLKGDTRVGGGKGGKGGTLESGKGGRGGTKGRASLGGDFF